ncbi:MAG TPA: 2Fe-2S iron-sulfur cluster-binding protein, partial [Nitrososphaerales archaeon]|nr:2Fe-2S iron-sulfur cluster-binding protein [Nitrososphaerales archaeon]
RVVKSCTVLAVQANGSEVLTVEGLSEGEKLNPVQKAFLAKHGLQCGFCTPGMLVASYALLQKNPDPTEDEIRLGISGNICRCTGYAGIVDSVRYAAKLKKKRK